MNVGKIILYSLICIVPGGGLVVAGYYVTKKYTERKARYEQTMLPEITNNTESNDKELE